MMTKEKKMNQIRRTFEVLKERPMTTKMIQVKTGIPRENLTRYISYLEKRNKVVTVKEKPCEITGHKAKHYSTDPMYFHRETQPDMFPAEGFQI